MIAPLTIVSGKGGVGKSLVAAALAKKLAARGQKTALVSLEASPHPWLSKSPTYSGTALADQLDYILLDAHLALKEYVKRKVRLPFLYLPVLDNPAVAKFLDALPLFSELMSLGKLYDLVGDESPYDHVIFDGPATGHCRTLLNVPMVATETLVAGPIYSNALKIKALLQDPKASNLMIVTLPEETPSTEAFELFQFASDELHMHCSTVAANRCLPQRFSQTDLRNLRSWADTDKEAQGLALAAEFESEIAATQGQHLDWLAARGLPLIQLPEIPPATEADEAVSLIGAVLPS